MKKMDQLEKSVKEANDAIKKHVPKIGGKSSLPTRSKHAPNFKLPAPDLQPIKEEVPKNRATPIRFINQKSSPLKAKEKASEPYVACKYVREVIRQNMVEFIHKYDQLQAKKRAAAVSATTKHVKSKFLKVLKVYRQYK
jgi:hypothetical protein